jgi:hypothetical protein
MQQRYEIGFVGLDWIPMAQDLSCWPGFVSKIIKFVVVKCAPNLGSNQFVK